MTATSTSTVAPGLASARSTHRLNQIDKVRANGVGEHVSLPQLVVCGDQSAGKSSVLERVTGIPFPRQEGLCTRFPTEIILRHSSEPLRLSASIHPSTRRSPEAQEPLRGYRRELSDMSELPSVINDSAALMGIRGHGPNENANAFAHDVLRIEIVGPVGLHLTIVDLPGLISVANDEQTDDDVCMVTEIVEKYLASSRTIIMAVVQAGNDVANQRIVQLARKYDPDGDRTVGIITKPDLINDGAEAKIAMLAKNLDAVKLKLGFFLVKNPSPSENKAGLSWDEFSRREKEFFSRAAWRDQALAMDRVGAEALRTFLQVLLDKHIEKELPKVREEIKRQLATKEAELSSMGLERRSPADIRYFLTNASMQFHRVAEAALDGNYQGPDADFFRAPGTRLRAEVHKANTQFADDLRVRGQKRKIVTENTDENADGESADENETQQVHVTKQEMTAWVKEVYMHTRGRELPGNHNHVLLEELFHEQSSPWPSIARNHLQKILDMVAQWMVGATDVCTQERIVRQEVLTLCQGTLDGAEKLALEELDKLIDDEKRHPITYNHYYTDNIQRARRDKQELVIEQALSSVKDQWVGKIHVSNVAGEFERLVQSMRKNIIVDMDDQACTEAMDGLTAYYKVAMKTFVDNVCRQVIERHVLGALPKLFCPSTVSTFSDEELVRIGSEPESQRLRRTELGALVSGLRQSLLDLQGSA
ncbi:Interferon-induced GTP-binding protein Mx-like protein [Pleurostoma richardsiae]|uniref:Interferon-induced GTP-binding protein Mx-like protein n=1 Tax=Pleurostoma richardsiae TaxID=41990 RepID=A0AA38RD96_9PEZI|nr:Interferon-induced GTP-binding protein Mx-like protein [Pleurostoma richardsiae]